MWYNQFQWLMVMFFGTLAQFQGIPKAHPSHTVALYNYIYIIIIYPITSQEYIPLVPLYFCHSGCIPMNDFTFDAGNIF